jgi:large subunit ribosomal protein L10
MTKQEKVQAIEDLTAQLAENQNIYLTDVSDLDALTTSNLASRMF